MIKYTAAVLVFALSSTAWGVTSDDRVEFEVTPSCVRGLIRGTCIVMNKFYEPIECQIKIFGKTENGRTVHNTFNTSIQARKYREVDLNVVGNYGFTDIDATADCSVLKEQK